METERPLTAVRRILAPNAGLMTGAGTNTYVVGTNDIAVVDPGPEDAVHLQAILAAGTIRSIFVTHTHRDHSPLAAPLARLTGARLIGLPAPNDGRQDLSFRPDIAPGDGERFEGEVTLTAIHTPGHASNCVCYLLPSERVLFTGDHVLEGVSPVILPPDGDMAAYLQSLEKLSAYDFERIAPGHGEMLPDGKRVIEALRRHRLARESKVLRALASDAGSLDRLIAVVYDDVPVERHGWAKLTLQAHLIKLAREGRIREDASGWRLVAA